MKIKKLTAKVKLEREIKRLSANFINKVREITEEYGFGLGTYVDLHVHTEDVTGEESIEVSINLDF